jgi:UDP-N-acetylmuramoyl-L-alanyl-D-glutamate--2,6-diaminopimelate ligase
MAGKLSDIIQALEPCDVTGIRDAQIIGISHDSRLTKPGMVFVAIRGITADGLRFVPDAVRAGVVAVIAESSPDADRPDVTWIQVPDARSALAKAAAVVNGDPTRDMTLIGITGTNGKTTVTYLLESIIQEAGGRPGVVGTVSYRWLGKEQNAARTTPEASDLQHMFADMLREGITHGVMEVSSHGLRLKRLDGCHFDVAVFTNLSSEHLDFHHDMEDYFQAKRVLFTKLLPDSAKSRPTAVINTDDEYGRRLLSELRETASVPVVTFGSESDNDISPVRADIRDTGIRARIQAGAEIIDIESPLTGAFNMSNILAATAAARSFGISGDRIRDGIARVQSVPGRLERVPSTKGSIFVDYAHTPDALNNVLRALQEVRKGKIISVMGCGGDRDTLKRPVMGKEAAAGSDFVVVTSDNPRTENPDTIIEQIVEGVEEHGHRKFPCSMNGGSLKSGHYRVITDRRQAVAWAVEHMDENDIVLVAGKGHETYQEINGVRYPFDDREVITEKLVLMGLSPDKRTE